MMTIEERIARLAVAVAAELPSVGVIGLGSGSTAEAVVRELGRRAPSEPGFAAIGVATSVRTRQLAESVGLTVCDLSEVDSIDIGFDGADEIDPELNLVKGKGGALLYEKLVAEICRDYMVISADEKLVARLGTRLPLPVEVIPYGWIHTRRRLANLGFTPEIREARTTPSTPTPATSFSIAPRILALTCSPSLRRSRRSPAWSNTASFRASRAGPRSSTPAAMWSSWFAPSSG